MTRRRFAWILGAVVMFVLAAPSGIRIGRNLLAERRAIATYTALLAASDAQDLAAVRAHCSGRYLAGRAIEPAPGGGIVGLPRSIHRNFRAWRGVEGVYLCPTNRVGPVYRFVLEADAWKFDGLAGLLGQDGTVEPVEVDEGGP